MLFLSFDMKHNHCGPAIQICTELQCLQVGNKNMLSIFRLTVAETLFINISVRGRETLFHQSTLSGIILSPEDVL